MWDSFHIAIGAAAEDSDGGLMYGISYNLDIAELALPFYAYRKNPDISYGWNAMDFLFTENNLPDNYGQVITLPSDVEVDETFCTWFSENAVKQQTNLIKAGTYRFKDVLCGSTGVEDYINEEISAHTVITINGTDSSFKIGAISLFAYEGTIELVYSSDSTFSDEGTLVVGCDDEWFTDEYGESIKTITFTEDAVVGGDFGAWFVCNTELVETPSENESEYDKGYQAGLAAGLANSQEKYNEGYELGYEDGYERGVEFGHKTGFFDGYSEGERDGHISGYNEGLAQGELIYYDKGLTEGFANGYEFGYADGLAYEGVDFNDLIITTAQSVGSTVVSMLDFQILGVNILSLVGGFILLGLCIPLIKLFKG